MSAIQGFALYLICCVIVLIVAKARSRSPFGFFLLALIPGPLLVILASNAGASSTAAGAIAFSGPAAALLISLASATGDQIASEKGSFRGKKKCPRCAETVKAEAIVCKHCGADLR